MPNPIDPSVLQLAMVLTAAGATVSAALIAAVILILKRVPGLGPIIANDNENFTAVVLAAALVIYAYVATVPAPGDLANIFSAFLAFVGIATLSGGTQAALAVTSLGAFLSGKPKPVPPTGG